MSACDNVGPLLDGYYDGELDSLERTRVEHHLQSCDACRRDLTSLEAVGHAVRAAVAGTQTPDVWRAIASQLPPERARVVAPLRARAPQRRRWIPAVAAAAVAASIFLVILDPGGFLGPDADIGPSGVVRSIYAPDRAVMVMEAEKSDDPTIIWLMEDAPEAAPHVRI